MIENYLRRITTVRTRITAGNLALVFLFILSIPLIATNQSFLAERLREVTEVEGRADRLLLQAATKVSSSRTDLRRYIQRETLGPNEALDDTAVAIDLVEEAAALPVASEQRQVFEGILDELTEYEELINAIEESRQSGQEDMVDLEVRALQLGGDLGGHIDRTVQENAVRVEAANEAVFAEARTRLIVLLVVYFVILLLSLFLAHVVRRSITVPIAALQAGAEQFARGRWETRVPISGNDELTALASTFNQMATDLIDSQALLEKRVVQRTESLEMSARISHNLSSILDQDAFSIAAVEQIQDTFNYYYVQLYLLNDVNNTLFLKSATGRAGQQMLIRGHHINMGRGIVGSAAETRKAVVVSDVSKSLEWLDNPLLPDTKSEAAIPIISRGILLGILDVQHNIVGGISQEEITLLTTIANQIAIALENSKLFDRIKQQANHEALLNRLSQKIQLASSVEQVLQITAQELGRALNANYTSVQLGKQRRPTNGHEKVG